MLAIPGNELSRHHHTQSFFTTFESTDSNQESVLQALAATSPNARALLNHPAWHWSRNHPAKGFQIPLTPPLRQLGQGDFTVEAWFRCADTNRNILFGNYAADYKGAINLELHTDNRLRLYIQPRSGSPRPQPLRRLH